MAWNQPNRLSPPPAPNAARFQAVTPMKETGRQAMKENVWVLAPQTVATAQDAQRLLLALQQKGFRAYARPLSNSEGASWRVFLGLKLDLEVLKALAQQLQASQALAMQIVLFNPLI